MNQRPRIIIIGAGFGGLFAANSLKGAKADVLLIDRHNYHTFTPLLYQVATCALEAGDIAYPVRGIFRGNNNISFLMGEVTQIDTEKRELSIRTIESEHRESYDYLIISAGSVTGYFGNNQLKQNAFALKTLADATDLRHHILKMFELAAWERDERERQALTTLVVVGGGPTGLETAGALFELYNHVLRKEFSRDLTAKVMLIEATDVLLRPYPTELQQAALDQLQSLGVEVVLNQKITEFAHDHVQLGDGRLIPTRTIVWSAGVEGNPLADMLGVTLQRGKRVPVKPTMEMIERDGIYVIGDMAYLEDPNGQPYPMLIPVASQQGTLAGKNLLRRLRGEPEQAFKYFDRGIMATIGRSRAVAWIFNRIPLRGWIAWVGWLFLHLLVMLGFRNRVNVLINWIWNYFTFDRGVRLIEERDTSRKSPQPQA
jgi:NADH:ubiquinone reductase (H+-translocating)